MKGIQEGEHWRVEIHSDMFDGHRSSHVSLTEHIGQKSERLADVNVGSPTHTRLSAMRATALRTLAAAWGFDISLWRRE